MKKISGFCLMTILCIGLLAGCASEGPADPSDSSSPETEQPLAGQPQMQEESSAGSEEASETSSASGMDSAGTPSAGTPTVLYDDGYQRGRIDGGL